MLVVLCQVRVCSEVGQRAVCLPATLSISESILTSASASCARRTKWHAHELYQGCTGTGQCRLVASRSWATYGCELKVYVELTVMPVSVVLAVLAVLAGDMHHESWWYEGQGIVHSAVLHALLGERDMHTEWREV